MALFQSTRLFTTVFVSIIAIQTIAVAQTSGWSTPLNFGLLTPSPRPNTVRFDDTYFISRDTGFVVSSYGMIFKTYDGAEHWQLKKSTNSYFRSIEFTDDGQYGVAGTLSGTVFRTIDRGETWYDVSSAITDSGADAKRICGLAHYGNHFYGVGWWGGKIAKLYKSKDAGMTWTTTLLDTNLVTGLVDAVFISPTKGFITGHRIYNRYLSESVVLRTLDGGNTWTKVFSDTTIGGGIWKIQFVDDQFGVGSIEPKFIDTVAMIRTHDGGDTWQLVPVGHVNAWRTYYGTQGIGFLNRMKGWMGGYYDGMFQTTDGGNTWDTLNVAAECDRFFRIDNIMYLSANTVYKYNGLLKDGIKNYTEPTYVHKLYPVAPNPATSNVTIEFDINLHQTNVVLQVVNTGARRTYPISSGYLKPGHYSYTWDNTDAPNGNYIVWLGTDEIPMVQKFVLSR